MTSICQAAIICKYESSQQVAVVCVQVILRHAISLSHDDIWQQIMYFFLGDNPYKVDTEQISLRASLLQRYLYEEQKELQALYALQALMVHMEQPASKCPLYP